ncbi:class I SAM-dependent methyltransferase [Tenggerimyces flavus]|uniref:Class I SAM-dependent methyltransferase n=1 Tax=Tenggerimyces flavus TaxID=1708749 RepID=A0ABV7YA40_9ACTN|nr:class I SAM-dependent methyltransferase [Tenggerimyces flavus]MBM7784979.1 SAM-dependent methyltransferase [Tenggerimyces flavus]
MSAIEPDYDTDTGRSAAWDPSWVVASEGWDEGAGRFVAEGLAPVLDVGCGFGGFAAKLSPAARWIGVDTSSSMLARVTARPVVQADALRLPFRDQSVGGVVCRNMLYHFERPADVIAEARRVLRPGGLFLAQTKARAQDPELVPDGYAPSTFDAEEAPAVVASVFGSEAVQVEAWDGPFMVLPDRAAVATYVRHHQLPAELGQQVATPLTLTKRGCLVWARKNVRR